jgi:hypothetical protein
MSVGRHLFLLGSNSLLGCIRGLDSCNLISGSVHQIRDQDRSFVEIFQNVISVGGGEISVHNTKVLKGCFVDRGNDRVKES